MTPPDGVPDLVWRWTAAGQRHDAAGGLLAKGFRQHGDRSRAGEPWAGAATAMEAPPPVPRR